MPAKKNRRPPELQEYFAEHVEATQEAFVWAEKAIELRKLGLTKQADSAERHAKKWLKKTMAIEARYPKPQWPGRAE